MATQDRADMKVCQKGLLYANLADSGEHAGLENRNKGGDLGKQVVCTF